MQNWQIKSQYHPYQYEILECRAQDKIKLYIESHLLIPFTDTYIYIPHHPTHSCPTNRLLLNLFRIATSDHSEAEDKFNGRFKVMCLKKFHFHNCIRSSRGILSTYLSSVHLFCFVFCFNDFITVHNNPSREHVFKQC